MLIWREKKDIRATMFVGKLEKFFVVRFLRFKTFVDIMKDFITRRWLSVSSSGFRQ